MGRIARQGVSLIYVTAVVTARLAGWNGLAVEKRLQNTDIVTCWKGTTLNKDKVFVNNAKNVKYA